MRMPLLFLASALVTSPMIADEAPVPIAVKALASLAAMHPARPESGPYNWDSGEYHYDGSGNIIAVGNEYYVYDVNGRLTKAVVKSPDAGYTLSRTYSYDDFGNMTAKGGDGGPAVTISVDGTSNHLNAAGMIYDTGGSLTSFSPPSSAHSYSATYDALGMLQRLSTDTATVYYMYTADDERIWTYDVPTASTPPATSYFTLRDLQGNVQRRFEQRISDQAWLSVRDYFYRDGSLLAASQASSSTVEHFSLDHLGTPRLITNASGNKIGFHVLFPFGEEWFPGTNPLQEGELRKFTGHERDRDIGDDNAALDYMHARNYSASVARFLSADPLGGTVRLPQSLNRYTYVLNTPIQRTDPTGAGDDDPIQRPDATDISNNAGLIEMWQFWWWKRTLTVLLRPLVPKPISVDVEREPGKTAVYLAMAPVLIDLPEFESAEEMLATIENAQLKDAAEALFRAGGDVAGGTAGAVRNELRTGLPTRGVYHWRKAYERSRQLIRMIRSSELSPEDARIAKAVLWDLYKAISGF